MASVLLFCLLFLSVMALILSFLHLYIFFHIFAQKLHNFYMISRFIPLAFFAIFACATPCFSASQNSGANADTSISKQENKDAKDVIRTGELTVWPKRVTNTVNISGVHAGTIVEITTISGELFKKAVAGNDGFIRIDMTDAEPGVYIVKAGEQQVKIYKR